MHCISLVLSRRLVAVLTSSAVTECDPVLLYNRLHVEYKGMATINLDNPSLEEISSTYKNIPEVDSKFQLKFVMFFGRHGARTPIRTLPNVEQVLWDKETIFSGAEHTEIDYEICSLDGGSRPEPVVENIYRKVILNGGAFGGQLTGVGMKQAYKLGQSLKSYYVDQLKFLSSEFTANDI
ncbi:putative lysophosphatidic acid phosphatase type 6 isoform X2 [Apostichopus japonicus]|uniref:Putative lysophosphatidic acid phosphatase type 6 isoform X2 n=1 Tax=Stichopus japonicus TaxID=307972 RepID=A0A2G8K2A9_STIJA|nr:putative lysophosphatidic acid phosphatase type 6 isoform X2 [Apostichopus japonicus]